MNKPANSAENVFARAIELPPGPVRDELLADECANAPALRREVESLLRAHDAAGDFLGGRAGRPANLLVTPANANQRTTAIDAAAHAGVFLRDADKGAARGIEDFIATMPGAIRRETRERIEAGLRVRQWCVRAEPPSAREEPPPVLPGFRLERKLGEGSLGVVYAAHDEKLNRRVAVKVLHHRADEAVRRRWAIRPSSRFFPCSTKPTRRPS
jgi:hypothetical protein